MQSSEIFKKRQVYFKYKYRNIGPLDVCSTDILKSLTSDKHLKNFKENKEKSMLIFL